MKKFLVSIAVLGGLVLASPAIAQRAHPAPRAEYRYDNHFNDRHEFRGHRDGEHRGRMEGRHRGHGDKHWREGREGGRGQKGFRGRGHGGCHKGAPGRGPRRGGRG